MENYEQMGSALLMKGLRGLSSQVKGFKSAVITMTNECELCQGSGKRWEMPIGIHDIPDNHREVDCWKCEGSGGIDMTINVDIKREPFKKEKTRKF